MISKASDISDFKKMILIVCVCEYEDSKRIDFSNIGGTWKPKYIYPYYVD